MEELSKYLEDFANFILNFDKDAFFAGLTKAFEAIYAVIKPLLGSAGK